MDKIGYEYENNTSYLTIQAMENQKTGYQIKMLLNNDIPGLLDISMRSMNNQTYYYYDVTFKKPLSKLYEFGKMTWEDVVCICKSIDTLTKAVDMYLLDISCVLILPEYMYLNVSDKEIRYVYCPDANREFQTMLKGLFEFILEHYQHGTDCKNQMRVYEIYQKIIDGNYKIHCLEQLTKESSHSPEKEKTIEFPHIQQDEPVVIEEVAPERVVTEEEKQPVHKIWGIEVGIGICAVLTVYAAAVLLFPEMAVIDMSVYFCVFLILAGCAGGVFLQKKRKKLKEMGAQNVLVSMGKIGAALIDEAGQEYFIKSPEGKRVNTVGSGDSMVAGFIAGFLKYNNYNDALRMGVSAGSASALSKYLATKEEVYNLFNNI